MTLKSIIIIIIIRYICADGHTHNLSFIQKPLEVVFLDVHQAGDVGDVEAVVLHVVGL